MSSSFLKKSEPREFSYKPRFYDPDADKRTGDHRRDFADELHREWHDKRKHSSKQKQTPWLTIMFMVFFAIVLAIVFFKFFA